METYGNNGVCQYIESRAKNIFLTDLSKSMLIIADKATQRPLTIVLDDRVDSPSAAFDDKEEKIIEIGKVVSDKSNLPFFVIRYCDGLQERFKERTLNIGEYIPNSDNKDVSFTNASIDYFVERLNERGVEASYESRSPQKKTNDKLSSDFHLWQRECLKVGIFVDIDMIRYDASKCIIERIYELKRSVGKFEEWKPYYKDINNYRILANFCEIIGAQFYIVYNAQRKVPPDARRLMKYCYSSMKKDGEEFFDDVRELRFFMLCKPIGGAVDELVPVETEHITIDHFIEDDQVPILREKYWNMPPEEAAKERVKDYIPKSKKKLCYCDPYKIYKGEYKGKFYHVYEDCEWLKQDVEKIKTMYIYEAEKEDYLYLCKKCKERGVQKTN